jgi:hypothetical protein
MRATCAAYLICLDFNVYHLPRITFQPNAGQFVKFITTYYLKFITTYYLPLPIPAQLSDSRGETRIGENMHENPVCTECPRRNVPDFGRAFLMLKYTDIIQNT